jgi:hypothetical protein
LWIFFGGRGFDREADIYASAPNHPVVSEGKICPVLVNHGYLRYVTEREASSLEFWRRISPSVVGLSALTMFMVVMIFRYPRSAKLRSN